MSWWRRDLANTSPDNCNGPGGSLSQWTQGKHAVRRVHYIVLTEQWHEVVKLCDCWMDLFQIASRWIGQMEHLKQYMLHFVGWRATGPGRVALLHFACVGTICKCCDNFLHSGCCVLMEDGDLRKVPPIVHWLYFYENLPILQCTGRGLKCDLCIIAGKIRMVFVQDWFCTALSAQWRKHRPGDWPCFMDIPATIHQVPGMGPTVAPPDQMHTWHLGVGQQVCGSTVAPWHAIFLEWNLNMPMLQSMFSAAKGSSSGFVGLLFEVVWRKIAGSATVQCVWLFPCLEDTATKLHEITHWAFAMQSGPWLGVMPFLISGTKRYVASPSLTCRRPSKLARYLAWMWPWCKQVSCISVSTCTDCSPSMLEVQRLGVYPRTKGVANFCHELWSYLKDKC